MDHIGQVLICVIVVGRSDDCRASMCSGVLAGTWEAHICPLQVWIRQPCISHRKRHIPSPCSWTLSIDRFVRIVGDFMFSRRRLWTKPSSGMWRRVAIVRGNVSEGRIASIIRVKRISELGTVLAVTILTFLARRFFHPDDRGNTFLRNVSSYNSYTTSHPKRRHFSGLLSFKN
jgi:hypothetical protein